MADKAPEKKALVTFTLNGETKTLPVTDADKLGRAYASGSRADLGLPAKGPLLFVSFKGSTFKVPDDQAKVRVYGGDKLSTVK